MILGGTVSLLLLLGGPQAPPEDRPTSGSGPLAEYPIEIGDPGDMGGGGSTVVSCKVSPGTEYNGRKYWIIVKTIKYSNGGTYTTSSGKYYIESEANNAQPAFCK